MEEVVIEKEGEREGGREGGSTCIIISFCYIHVL